MTQYDKQAKDYLDKYGLKIDWLYMGRSKYFDDDKETRDVYTFVLRRMGRAANGELCDIPNAPRFSGKFGNSINDSNEQPGKHPSAYSLLASLSGDVNIPDNFEDFCSYYGYDTDSIKALKSWKRCDKYAKRLRVFLTKEMQEELQEIQ